MASSSRVGSQLGSRQCVAASRARQAASTVERRDGRAQCQTWPRYASLGGGAGRRTRAAGPPRMAKQSQLASPMLSNSSARITPAWRGRWRGHTAWQKCLPAAARLVVHTCMVCNGHGGCNSHACIEATVLPQFSSAHPIQDLIPATSSTPTCLQLTNACDRGCTGRQRGGLNQALARLGFACTFHCSGAQWAAAGQAAMYARVASNGFLSVGKQWTASMSHNAEQGSLACLARRAQSGRAAVQCPQIPKKQQI